jgi:hypothetical protein
VTPIPPIFLAAGPGVAVQCVISSSDGTCPQSRSRPSDDRRARLRMAKRRCTPVIRDVGGVVVGGGVPAGGEGLAGELERDSVLDRAGGTVAGLPDAEDLPGGFYRDLDRPPAGVSLDHLRAV